MRCPDDPLRVGRSDQGPQSGPGGEAFPHLRLVQHVLDLDPDLAVRPRAVIAGAATADVAHRAAEQPVVAVAAVDDVDRPAHGPSLRAGGEVVAVEGVVAVPAVELVVT